MSDEGALRKEAHAKRASAARARRLVTALTLDADKAQLLRYAQQLEAEATELERQAAAQGAVPPPVGSVEHAQGQQQQQNSTDVPPDSEPEPKQ
jgi:hypothetical protein